MAGEIESPDLKQVLNVSDRALLDGATHLVNANGFPRRFTSTISPA